MKVCNEVIFYAFEERQKWKNSIKTPAACVKENVVKSNSRINKCILKQNARIEFHFEAVSISVKMSFAVKYNILCHIQFYYRLSEICLGKSD